MKRLLFIPIILSVLLAAAVEDGMLAKADRAYAAKEWAGAQALYGLVSERNPQSPTAYARAIVASEMLGDSAAAIDRFSRAMSRSIPVDSILACVRTEALATGDGALYPRFLENTKAATPWLSRAIDSRLLEYYVFRRDPEMMAATARTMLAGRPDNTAYLNILAEAQLMMGHDDEAVATYKHILEIDPDNLTALLTLGNYYRTTSPAEAALLLQRAYRLAPTPYLESIGTWVKGEE